MFKSQSISKSSKYCRIVVPSTLTNTNTKKPALFSFRCTLICCNIVTHDYYSSQWVFVMCDIFAWLVHKASTILTKSGMPRRPLAEWSRRLRCVARSEEYINKLAQIKPSSSSKVNDHIFTHIWLPIKNRLPEIHLSLLCQHILCSLILVAPVAGIDVHATSYMHQKRIPT